MIRSKSSTAATTMQNIPIFKQTHSFNDDKICLILCCNVENILRFSHISYLIQLWWNIYQNTTTVIVQIECI